MSLGKSELYYPMNTLNFSIKLRFLTQAAVHFYYLLIAILIISLKSNPQWVKFSVAVFFFGIAISLFLSGPLIDQLGIKKNLKLGLWVFIVGTIICIVSTNIYLLMIGRFIQALAVGLLQTASKSILATSSNRTLLFSIYRTWVNFSPAIAMLITAIILYFLSWQASFIFLLLFACYLLYKTHHLNEFKETTPQSTRNYFKIYQTLAKEKGFLALILSYSLVHTILVPFYITASYVLLHVLHDQPYVIALMTGVFTVVSILGSEASVFVESTRFKKYIIEMGFGLAFVGCFIFFMGTLLFSPSVLMFIVTLFTAVFGNNLFYARFNHQIMERFGHISNNVTLAFMAVTIAVLSAITTLIGSFHQTITETAFLMMMMALLAIIFYRSAPLKSD